MNQLNEAARAALRELDAIQPQNMGAHVYRTREDLRTALAAEQPAEPVAFNHDIGADRFKVVKGSFWWHIRIGDSTGNVGKFHTKMAAEDVALKLLTAFRDGAYMQFHASPAAPAQVPQPLTKEQVKALCAEAGYLSGPVQHRADFINGLRHGERAHGIGITKETTT